MSIVKFLPKCECMPTAFGSTALIWLLLWTSFSRFQDLFESPCDDCKSYV